jgi:hypothetical protein
VGANAIPAPFHPHHHSLFSFTPRHVAALLKVSVCGIVKAQASFSFAGKMSRVFLLLDVDVNGEELFVVDKVTRSRLFVFVASDSLCGSCFASAMEFMARRCSLWCAEICD